MVALLPLSIALLSTLAQIEATGLFDRNLAYSSPFTNAPHVCLPKSRYRLEPADNESATLSCLTTLVLFKDVMPSLSRDNSS